MPKPARLARIAHYGPIKPLLAVAALASPVTIWADEPVDPLFTQPIVSEPIKTQANKTPAAVEPTTVTPRPPAPDSDAPTAAPATLTTGDVRDNSISECRMQLAERLKGVNMEYEAQIKSFSVTSERRLSQLNGEEWQLETSASWLFMGIEEQSRFRLPDWQLVSFEHERKGMGDRHNLRIQVNPDQQLFTAKARGKSREYPYRGVLFDALDHQLRLQMDVACQPDKQLFKYPIAKRKGLKLYEYRRVAEESLRVDGRDWQTVKLEKIDNDQTTVVWLAKELGYTIVKLVHEEDGERNSLALRKVPSLNPAPAKPAQQSK